METQSYSETPPPSTGANAPVAGTVSPPAQRGLGPRVLELSSVLQTTLDLDQQIELLGEALGHDLGVDGLSYITPSAEKTVRFGSESAHSATYDLQLEDRSLGTIRAFREEPFIELDILLLENLLCALVYPLRNALTYRQAVEMASRDPLTGAFNRRALETSIAREVDLAHRQRLPLSLLVIDIDHFKAFNDEHGHAFGDDVLIAITQTIGNTIRRSDLLFRYGGEEFVVLASHTGDDGAMLLAERIRENIAALRSVRGRDIDITVSAGIARLDPADNPQTLFDRADSALYTAKQAGRNRCEVAAN